MALSLQCQTGGCRMSMHLDQSVCLIKQWWLMLLDECVDLCLKNKNKNKKTNELIVVSSLQCRTGGCRMSIHLDQSVCLIKRWWLMLLDECVELYLKTNRQTKTNKQTTKPFVKWLQKMCNQQLHRQMAIIKVDFCV